MCDPTTILAGANIVGGLLGADAAQSAADTQANAANRASDTQLQMFNTINQQNAPYREAGYTALNDILSGFGHAPAASSTTSKDYYNTNPDAFSATWHKYSDPYGKYISESSPEYSDILSKTMADLNSQGIKPAVSAGGATSANGGIPSGYFSHQFDANDLNANLAPNYQFVLDQGTMAAKNAGNLQTGLLSGNTLRGVQDYVQGLAGNQYQQAFNNYTANQGNIFSRLASIAGLGGGANQTSATAGTSAANSIGNAQMAGGQAAASGIVGATNALTGGANNAASWYALPQILRNGGVFGTGVTTGAPYQTGGFGGGGTNA